MNKKYFLFVLLIVITLLIFLTLVNKNNLSDTESNISTKTVLPTAELVSPSPFPTSSPTSTAAAGNLLKSGFVTPVDDFRQRITKKNFGEYFSPENSPIEEERFTGYHTGVDVEYEDMAGRVEVQAISPGEVIYSDYVNGYGGVEIISHNISGENISSLYGHLDPSSLLGVGAKVTKGQIIGELGEQGYETDGERKHLHFAIYDGQDIELRGYVDCTCKLDKWRDPINFLYNK